MEKESIQDLEKLGLYCYVGGIITVFLGIFIIFVNMLAEGVKQTQDGLFILIVGYAFIKISARITKITNVEKSKTNEKWWLKTKDNLERSF